MKYLVFIFFLALQPYYLFGQESIETLIDFDQKSSKRYLRNNRVITFLVDEASKFYFTDDLTVRSKEVVIRDIQTNFTTLYSNGRLTLKISNIALYYDWFKAHQSYRMYVSIDETRGIYRLVGYSKGNSKPRIKKKFTSKEKIELVDFTDMDTSALNPENYVVGPIDLYSCSPLFFRKQVTLDYPTDLAMNPTTFMGVYNLKERISVNMSERIIQLFNGMAAVDNRLVLKKTDGLYKIVGFTRKK
ncbi:hypothetical protein [Aquimarina spongiae]|uniref:Uncharacterized protein n=1 Tax=Aquimarina spongiae TaxID=570521 RepID=A0A1M6GJS9_9FLAO|nr:hypothetical protein [Aquimarina spongiae]SHJ10150.1 hypothetical protein SAMN04488508_105316 [Aquimarina spongiae]